MTLNKIGGGGGADYVQDSPPGGADVGETWIDTSQDPPKQKVYDGQQFTTGQTQQAGMDGGYNRLVSVSSDNTGATWNDGPVTMDEVEVFHNNETSSTTNTLSITVNFADGTSESGSWTTTNDGEDTYTLAFEPKDVRSVSVNQDSYGSFQADGHFIVLPSHQHNL